MAGHAEKPIEGALRARRVLRLAGQALDPNAEGGADPILARDLLVDALVLAKAAGADERADELLRVLGDEHAPKDLTAAELLVTQILDAAEGHEKTRRAARRRPWMFAVLLVLVALTVLTFNELRFPWRAYHFRTSSAAGGYSTEGTLGEVKGYDLLFHTQEEENPWVEVDLGKMREISRIVARQRIDCCKDRGLPMVVEIAGEDRAFRQVGERDTEFEKWDIRFPPESARWVRIRSTATTTLHLADIQIR